MAEMAQSEGGTVGFLFTNAGRLVVYADGDFRKMIGSRGGDSLVGAALHTALGMEEQAANEFFDTVRDDGAIENRLLNLSDRTGQEEPVAARGWASYDDRRKFTGVRIIVRHLSEADRLKALEPRLEVVSNAGVFKIVSRVDHLDDAGLLELYFNAHLEELQVVAALTAGLPVRAKLEARVNEAAERNGWDMRWRTGCLAAGRRMWKRIVRCWPRRLTMCAR